VEPSKTQSVAGVLLRDKIVWVGLIAFCLIALAAWLVFKPLPSAGGAIAAAPAAQLPAIPMQPPVPAQALAAPAPAGLSAQEWQQLNDALKDHPQREAEIARVTNYLRFAQSVQQFQTLREQTKGAPSDALRALAQTLNTGLEDRLKQGELSGGEAQLLKAAVLEVLMPDAAQRNTALRQWQQARAAPTAVADAREAVYQREQATLLAAWQALPAAQRDEKQLEAQLEALRQRIFNP
jgi:hypothetical protein